MPADHLTMKDEISRMKAATLRKYAERRREAVSTAYPHPYLASSAALGWRTLPSQPLRMPVVVSRNVVQQATRMLQRRATTRYVSHGRSSHLKARLACVLFLASAMCLQETAGTAAASSQADSLRRGLPAPTPAPSTAATYQADGTRKGLMAQLRRLASAIDEPSQVVDFAKYRQAPFASPWATPLAYTGRSRAGQVEIRLSSRGAVC